MPGFEVRTVEWLPAKRGDRVYHTRSPASEGIARHDDYASAHDDCEAFDAAKWAAKDFNPFLYGGAALFFQTTLPPGVFCDYLLDRGIEPPDAGPAATNGTWVAWWWQLRPTLTPETRAAVREALNLIRFAEVVTLPPAVETVYMVQEIFWEFADNSTFDADPEGGAFLTAYRDKAKAEARCAELHAERRAEWTRREPGFAYNYSTEHRVNAEWRPDTGIDGAVFFEVVEVEVALAGGP